MAINQVNENLDWHGGPAGTRALTAFAERVDTARLSAHVHLALIDVLTELRGEIHAR